MDRRSFIAMAASAPLAGATASLRPEAVRGNEASNADGRGHAMSGKTLPPWKPGEFQVHFIYTGVCESMFWIMPDGTSMLLDCGDHPAYERGKKAVWVLPDAYRHAGEWIARYVLRVNPSKESVDYMMVSHHHSDHAGRIGYGAGVRKWKGRELSVSGFLHAADTLRFKRGFDRGWPDFNDPIPDGNCDTVAYRHVRDTIDFLSERDGLEMEKFRVGGANQVAMLKNASAHPLFKIVNIAANGKILRRDGSIRDLYEKKHGAKRLNENGMSLGMVVEYGPFRFYTAGDFSDRCKQPDGSVMDVETELAGELDMVDVAKINHHGHHSMPGKIVSALAARVWVACVWDQLHVTADTLGNLCDRSLYPGPRLVAPGVFSPLRRIQDAGRPYIADIAPESFEAGHVVLTVAPGGKTYNVAYVTADDESMKVTGAYDFVSRGSAPRPAGG